MTFEVVADRRTVYQVEAATEAEAMDLMITGKAVEVDGTTYSLLAAPCCPAASCSTKHDVMDLRASGTGQRAWECATCGYVYGEP